jgi:F-type H+-transporting ATPase subunit b
MLEAEDWVAIAFMIFLGVLAWLGVHRKLTGALDRRQARIKAELDEAVRLKDEARALLADYQRKQREAEREAQAILAGARSEAARLAAEASSKMKDFIARRTGVAETRIAQAEAQALADVRSAAADAAVAAAGKTLSESTDSNLRNSYVTRSIEELQSLNGKSVRSDPDGSRAN